MTLILPQSGEFTEPFPPRRFTYESESRQRYPVRPEVRGDNTYWYMRKVISGELHNIYIAPSGKLELAMLENAALLIEYRTKFTEERLDEVKQ